MRVQDALSPKIMLSYPLQGLLEAGFGWRKHRDTGSGEELFQPCNRFGHGKGRREALSPHFSPISRRNEKLGFSGGELSSGAKGCRPEPPSGNEEAFGHDFALVVSIFEQGRSLAGGSAQDHERFRSFSKLQPLGAMTNRPTITPNKLCSG